MKTISSWGRLAACGALASGLLASAGCSGGAGSKFRSLPIDGAWTFGTADYSEQTAPEDIVTRVEPLPAPFTGSGLVLAATNRSDDALVYAVRVVDELPPGSNWDVGVDPEIVTQTPTGCVGVGGSPGESVWMVASAAGKPIAPVLINGETRLDLDRGNQSQGGPQGVVLGTIAATSTNCSGEVPAESKSFLAGRFLTAQADAQGRIWVMVGMDSGFEARSRIWIRSVRLRLRPA